MGEEERNAEVTREGKVILLTLTLGELTVEALMDAMGAARLGHMLMQASGDAKRYEKKEREC